MEGPDLLWAVLVYFSTFLVLSEPQRVKFVLVPRRVMGVGCSFESSQIERVVSGVSFWKPYLRNYHMGF